MASLTTAPRDNELPNQTLTSQKGLSKSISEAYLSVASRPLLACAITALLPVVLRLVLLHWYPAPIPGVHDEFSYLLGADTFASGRITNPPHPLWQHFETMHVLQQPHYASKYPPLQALLLAAGQLLGNPFLGLLLSVAIMGWCFCWAMQGWLPKGIAFAGALLAAAHLGPFWSNIYWGGATGAIGGALLAGSLPRLIDRPRRSAAFAFALGLVVLGNSRPYEGLAIGAATAGVLLFVTARNSGLKELLRISAIPVLLTLAIAGVAMGYYNYRVTGSPTLLPYQLHEQQYAVYSNFLWAKPRAIVPAYNNDVLKLYWTKFNQATFEYARAHWPKSNLESIGLGFGLLLALPWMALLALFVPLPRSAGRSWLTLPILLAFAVAMLPLEDFKAHYVGVIAAFAFIRFTMTLRALWSFRPAARPIGPVIAMFAFELVLLQSLWLMNTNDPEMRRFAKQRADIENSLAAKPGQHVVLVRYQPDHIVHEEWVYNRANIDASRVIWARDLGGQRNTDLLNYYAGRKIWLLEPDHPGAAPQPFTPAAR